MQQRGTKRSADAAGRDTKTISEVPVQQRGDFARAATTQRGLVAERGVLARNAAPAREAKPNAGAHLSAARNTAIAATAAWRATAAGHESLVAEEANDPGASSAGQVEHTKPENWNSMSRSAKKYWKKKRAKNTEIPYSQA